MLTRKTILLTLLSLFFKTVVFSQTEKEITGTVFDASTGNPIEGISVSAPGIAASITNEEGIYTLQIPEAVSTIHVEGLNYQTKYVSVNNAQVIYVYENDYYSFNKHAELFYESVPLKYTTQAVSIYNSNDNTWKSPGYSLESTFDDKIPGLEAKARSGVPSLGSDIFIRGISSLYAGSQPLIIVDGYIYDIGRYGESVINGFLTNPLANIDVNDIENVTIVKDAASIYGAKAANGVIFIRTKHAEELATKIDFSAYGGINYAPNQIPMMEAEDYKMYLSEILETSSLTSDEIQELPYMIEDPGYVNYNRYHNNTNWQDEIYTNSINQNYKLNIQGGDEKALYAISVGYLNSEGIIKNTDYSRFGFRFNSDINVSEILSINSNISLTYNESNLKDESYEQYTSPIFTSLVKAPFLYPKVITEFGTISPNIEESDIFGISNPVAIIDDVLGISKNYRVFASVNGNLKITDGLTFSNLLGINYDKIRDNIFKPDYGLATQELELDNATNSVTQKVERLFSLYNDARFRYEKTFGYNHNFSALLGTRIGLNQIEGDWGKDYNTPSDEIRSLGNGNLKLKSLGGYLGEWSWVTHYLHSNYNYSNKYFASVGVSLDGSSRFGEEADGVNLYNSVFGLFPSVSVGWLMSSEEFLSKVSVIDILKLRASYGIVGNDNIGNYNAKRLYVNQNLMGAQGIVNGGVWNPGLKWETVTKKNAGIDLAILKERISISFDVYEHLTEDMLNIIYETSPFSGYDSYLANEGAFSTKGIDLNVNARVINSALKWDIGLVLSKYVTEITEFPGNRRITNFMGANILTEVGNPLGVFYGYEVDKENPVFITQAEADAANLRALMPNTDLIPFSAGDVRFVDQNNDDIIDENDMVVIGDPNPDLTGMLMSSVSWKGITIEAAVSFSYGNEIYNFLRYNLESMQNAYNQTETVLNRWRVDGQETEIPRAAWGDPMGNARFSDRWIEDGSYARLKYVTVSYKLPVKPRILKGIELFVSGRNLVTFTNYLGLDTEFSMASTPFAQGIDVGLTPQPKAVFAGIKLGL